MGQAAAVEAIEVKAPAVDDDPLPLPARAVISGVGFGLSLPIAQYAGKFCRISCATPVLSSLFGAASVALCSTSSVQIVHELWGNSSASSDHQPWQLLLPALIGILSFKTLGGRFRNILPSDVRFPGAHARVFIPARGAHYASNVGRFIIKSLYREFGCHHCGKTTGESIADHMPPNAVHWKSRRVLKVTQKYYPQCTKCMKIQSAALRHGSNPLVFHRKQGWPEPYVFSGFLVAALQPDESDVGSLLEELNLLLDEPHEQYTLGHFYTTLKGMFGEYIDP